MSRLACGLSAAATMPKLVPVTVSIPATSAATPRSCIEIELATGTVRLKGQVSAAQLRDVLAALVQQQLAESPCAGRVFCFRGRRGDRIKVLWFDGDGLWLLAKRLERGKFVWPQARYGTCALSSAQLSMLLEGIDWRRIRRTAPQPELAV